MTRRLVLAAAAAVLVAGCNTGFEPQYRVVDVRILAIRDQVQGSVSTADVAPGETLVLDALVARPRDGLRVSWFGCLPPASEAGTPCADRSFLEDPARLRTEPGIVPIGTSTFPAVGTALDLVATATMSLGDPAVVAALDAALAVALTRASEDPAYRCRVYRDLDVVAVVEAPGIRPQAALKRVRITSLAAFDAYGLDRSLYTVNLNPAIQHVRVGATDPDACTGGTALVSGGPFPPSRLSICGEGDAGQDINVCDASGPIPSSEAYGWQWYVTAGEFPDEGGVGNADGVSVDFIRPAGPFSLWTIARDQRGGTAWQRLDFAGL